LLTVDVRFRRALDVQQVESAIDRLEARIRQQEPTIEKSFIEPDPLKAPARQSSKAA
jgi:divalent metal cation (Fe/Co/Zn/Cd) transporter